MSKAFSSLLASRKFLLASVTGIVGFLAHYGLVPAEVLELFAAWAGVLLVTITAEDVAAKIGTVSI